MRFCFVGWGCRLKTMCLQFNESVRKQISGSCDIDVLSIYHYNDLRERDNEKAMPFYPPLGSETGGLDGQDHGPGRHEN